MSRKGTLTGGYYDSRSSRLELQRLVWETKQRLESAEGEKAEFRHQLADILPTQLTFKYLHVCVP